MKKEKQWSTIHRYMFTSTYTVLFRCFVVCHIIISPFFSVGFQILVLLGLSSVYQWSYFLLSLLTPEVVSYLRVSKGFFKYVI